MNLQYKSSLKLAFFLCLIFSSCSDNNTYDMGRDDDMNPIIEVAKPLSINQTEQSVINGQEKISLAFLREYINSNHGENFACSPFSLSNVLAISANGANTIVKNEILKSYGLDENGMTTLNNLHKFLLHELPLLDKHTVFTSANSISLNPNHDIIENFEQIILHYFNAQILKIDLSTLQGVNQINKWCSDHTNGLIPNFFEQPLNSPFAITSADYFHSKWRNPFDKKNTSNRLFRSGNGNQNKVPTMLNTSYYFLYSDTELSVVQLDYGNKAFRLSVILPGTFDNSHDFTLEYVAKTLTFDKWKHIKQNASETLCKLYLPKFEISTKNNVTQMLEQLNVKSLLHPGAIDGITETLPGLCLSNILQAVTIKVEENGTTAASVTSGIYDISTGPTTNPQTIHIDRPFIFIIDESSTGTILYAGAVTNL